MASSTSVHPSPGTAGHVVVGLLPNVDAARRALETMRSYGISDEQIGLAMRHADSDALSEEGDAPAATGQDTAKGALGGGIIGGLAGLLTATGIVAIPGLAPLLAGGALISLVGATGASVIAGSGVGAGLADSWGHSSASTFPRPPRGSMKRRCMKGKY